MSQARWVVVHMPGHQLAANLGFHEAQNVLRRKENVGPVAAGSALVDAPEHARA